MRLSEQSHGYQKTIINKHWSTRIPFPVNAWKLRLSTVDALERNPSGRRTIIRNDFTSRSVRATQGGAAVVRPDRPIMEVPVKPSTKRSAKGRVKSSTVAIYASVFALLVAVIAVGYRAPQEVSSAASAAPVANAQIIDQPAVNDVVAADIAASVADAAGLAIAPNVAELAVSTRIKSEYSNAADTSTITKPVIVQLSAASRKISTYEVKEGDTIASVAKQFGISQTTLRWANDLDSTDTLAVGATISILPVNGVVYTVKDGDTLEKIAKKYKANASTVITYNDLELNGVSAGLKIIIPDGVLPTTERPGYIATPVYTFVTGYSAGFSGESWYIRTGTPMYSGNKGAFGNCTAYAFDRRIQLGMPLKSVRWGNAAEWAQTAGILGYKVDHTPSVGAVMQNSGGYRGYGHVAIVEEIRANGDLRISEMNASVPGGGYNIVSGRIIPASIVGQYAYIH